MRGQSGKGSINRLKRWGSNMARILGDDHCRDEDGI